MNRGRALLPLLAVAWAIAAVAVVGAPRLDAAVPWLSGSTAAPSPGAVAGVGVWCAMMVVTALAAVDVMRRRRRPRITPAGLVVVAGAAILLVGCVAELTSYRVCCAPSDIVSAR